MRPPLGEPRESDLQARVGPALPCYRPDTMPTIENTAVHRLLADICERLAQRAPCLLLGLSMAVSGVPACSSAKAPDPAGGESAGASGSDIVGSTVGSGVGGSGAGGHAGGHAGGNGPGGNGAAGNATGGHAGGAASTALAGNGAGGQGAGGGAAANSSGAAGTPKAGAAGSKVQSGVGGSSQSPGALVSFLGNPDYPDGFWKPASWEESNVDEQKIEGALKDIAQSKMEIHSFVMARHGRLVCEYYGWKTGQNSDDPDKSEHQVDPNERHLVHSTTKSITSTLVGIAIDEGRIPGIDDLVVPHFPEYQPLPEPSADKDAMTLEDLLTMRSGLKWQEGADDDVFWTADPAKTMLSRPLVDTPVGTVWNYSSGGSDIIAALLRKATGMTPLAYANEKLFGPLGLADVVWEASSNDTNHGGWGLELAPREMARFGELYRNRGVWNGKQVVPADWTEVATAAHCDTPWSGKYGYHFWIPNLPGFFGTRGAYGQNIYVNRSLELVVAFTSDLPVQTADSTLDGLMQDWIIPAVK